MSLSSLPLKSATLITIHKAKYDALMSLLPHVSCVSHISHKHSICPISGQEQEGKMRFQVLTAASVKMAVFWVVAPRSLVKFTDIAEVFAATIIAKTQERAIFKKETDNIPVLNLKCSTLSAFYVKVSDFF
jgi:hypothetical protein